MRKLTLLLIVGADLGACAEVAILRTYVRTWAVLGYGGSLARDGIRSLTNIRIVHDVGSSAQVPFLGFKNDFAIRIY